MTRKLRRNHEQRLKKVRYNQKSAANSLQVTPKEVGKALQTPKPCSCHMCGNARKHFKRKTLKERKQELYLVSDLRSNNF